MYKRILLPLDGSDRAKQAMPYAIAQAERFDAELVLLQVLAPSTGVHSLGNASHQWVSGYKSEMAYKKLEDAAADARQHNIAVRVSTTKGHPPTKIIEFAEENEIDLIVLSTRRRSGLSRWLASSVAENVMRGTTVPVLLVYDGHGNGQEDNRGKYGVQSAGTEIYLDGAL